MVGLAQQDPEVAQAIQQESERQRNSLVLIASENYASRAVLEAQATVLSNKYAEGYPGARYYGGCQYVDVAEVDGVDGAVHFGHQCFFTIGLGHGLAKDAQGQCDEGECQQGHSRSSPSRSCGYPTLPDSHPIPRRAAHDGGLSFSSSGLGRIGALLGSPGCIRCLL